MGRWRKKPQMVLCAALGRGHMIPMMGLARSLASTGEISVTIVFQNAGARNSIQEATFFSGLDVELAVLDAANLCEDPPWLTGGSVSARMHKDRSRRSPKAAAGSMDPESALRELLADLLASPSPPVCLVADFSLPWTAAPARDLDLARYVLYTDPANFMAVAYSCKKLVEMAILPAKDPREKKIAVPGVPDLSQHDISQYIWDTRDEYHPRVELWHRKTVESDGVLLNTFYELESSAVDALREEILPGTSLFTVGPLIATGSSGSESDSRCAVYGAEKNACMEWLDSKPESSVLYVSFGSWEVLVDDQITELARALESSGCFFLWVVRLAPGSSIGSLLPQGFESRVIAPGRGLIVTTWAPQQEILKHQATGGFVTHCGWNSVLECVCLAGVPMVCWPLISDQPTTCRFVVDGLRIGVEIHEDATGFVDRVEIENAVKMVMVEGAEMRRIAKDYKRLAAIAASEEGSSSISLREFMDKALKGRSYVPCNSGNST